MTKINPLIFRAYDIRGIADPKDPSQTPDLTPETSNLIGKGIGTYLVRKLDNPNPKIALGRDGRLTGPSLSKALAEGLASTGCQVTDIGLSTSPLLYYTTCKYDFDGGINLTASHNPKQYNGVKVVGANAHSICGDELQDILKLIQSEDFVVAQSPLPLEEQSPFDDYLADLTKNVKLARPLKIVVDAGNGVAGPFVPQILRAIGCEVTELYCDVDGNFPNHEANPEEEENLHELMAKVKELGADLGMGFDGDGDRIGVIDENGKHYSADYLLMLYARDLLSRLPGSKIVFDVKVSQVVIDDIAKHGGEPVMCRTGHSFIETKMREIDSPLAGEVSGHIFFGENYYGFDDAALAAVRMIEYIASKNQSFSEHFNGLPKLYTTPEFKASCPDDKKFEIVKSLTEHFASNYDAITIDGVRVNFDAQSWGAVRASNTSPNLTLRFEANSPERLAEIQEIMVKELQKHPEVGLSWYQK